MGTRDAKLKEKRMTQSLIFLWVNMDSPSILSYGTCSKSRKEKKLINENESRMNSLTRIQESFFFHNLVFTESRIDLSLSVRRTIH